MSRRRRRARWPRRAAPTFSRQRRRTPRMTLSRARRSVDVGHRSLTRLGRAPGAGWTAPSPRQEQAGRHQQPPPQRLPALVLLRGQRRRSPRRVTSPPCSCVTAPASSSGSRDARSDSDAVEVDRGHPRPAPALERPHLVVSRSRQLERALPGGQPLLLARRGERPPPRVRAAPALGREIEGLAHGVPRPRLHVAGGVADELVDEGQEHRLEREIAPERVEGGRPDEHASLARPSSPPARPCRRRSAPARRPSPPASGSGRSARRRSRRCAVRGTARTPGGRSRDRRGCRPSPRNGRRRRRTGRGEGPAASPRHAPAAAFCRRGRRAGPPPSPRARAARGRARRRRVVQDDDARRGQVVRPELRGRPCVSTRKRGPVADGEGAPQVEAAPLRRARGLERRGRGTSPPGREHEVERVVVGEPIGRRRGRPPRASCARQRERRRR